MTLNLHCFDSRTAQGRIDYLERMEKMGTEDLDDDQLDELSTLRKIKDEVYFVNWDNGTTIIRDDYFTHFVEQQCYDMGEIREGSFLANLIDWDKAAEHFVQDYKSIAVNSTAYWYRA